MERFNFSPRGDVRRTVHYLDRTIDFESGAFQVQRVAVKPVITFEMTFEGTSETLKPLEEFYLKHRKTERFAFTYFNEDYICQFTSDYTPTETLGWNKYGKFIGKISVTLTMRVVIIDGEYPFISRTWEVQGNVVIPPDNESYYIVGERFCIPAISGYVDIDTKVLHIEE